MRMKHATHLYDIRSWCLKMSGEHEYLVQYLGYIFLPGGVPPQSLHQLICPCHTCYLQGGMRCLHCDALVDWALWYQKIYNHVLSYTLYNALLQ